MLSVLCVRLTIKVKVGIPESFKVGWYLPKKKLGRVTLSSSFAKRCYQNMDFPLSKCQFKQQQQQQQNGIDVGKDFQVLAV